ncbi:MAG: GAF domain-containing protein [Anaerolineae bacterium]|nr:GAF domain-containing protein [Anaerolineae bacterium]
MNLPEIEHLLESISDPFYALDHQWHFTYVNQKAAQLWGQSRDFLLGKHIWETFPSGVASESYRLMHQVMNERKSARYETFSDFLKAWVEVNIYPTQNGIAVYFRDVDERKQVELRLSQSEQRYRSLFETAPIALWEEDFSAVYQALQALKQQGITDFRQYFHDHPDFVRQIVTQVHVTDINAATLQMFKAQSRADLLGSLDKIFLDQTYRVFTEELIALAEGQRVFSAEAEQRTLIGEPLNAIITVGFPEGDDTFQHVIISIIDITRRKRAEQRMIQLQALTAAFSEALHPTEIAKIIVARGRELVGAAAASIGLLTDDGQFLETLLYQGYSEELMQKWQRIPITISSGITTAVREQRAVWLESPQKAEQYHIADHERPRDQGHQAWAALPLISNGRVLGVLALSFYHPNPFVEDDRRLMVALADQSAQALERARLYVAEYQARIEAERERLQAFTILESISDGFVSLDREWRYVYVNQRALQLLNRTRDQLIGQIVWETFPEVLNSQFYLKAERSLTTQTRWDDEEYVSAIGIWVSYRLYPSPSGLSIYFEDITQQKRAQQRSMIVQDLTAALVRAMTAEEVATEIIHRGILKLGAHICVVMIVGEHDQTLLLMGDAANPNLRSQRLPYSSFGKTPLTDAVEGGQPIWIETGADYQRQYPAVFARFQTETQTQALIAIPVTFEDRVVGAFGISFPSERRYDADELAFIVTMGQQCAQALERARLYEAEQRARETAEAAKHRLEFIAHASRQLSSTSLNLEQTLKQITDLVIPTLADWCIIDLVENDDLQHTRRVALSHSDPAMIALFEQMMQEYPDAYENPHGHRKVIRTQESTFVPGISDQILREVSKDERQFDYLRRLGLKSSLIVPLTARNRPIGALTLTIAESGRVLDQADVLFAEELAQRLALAIENARLYQTEQQSRQRAQQAAAALARLQTVTAQFANALTPTEIGQIALDQLVSTLTAIAGTVVLQDRDDEYITIYTVGYASFGHNPPRFARNSQRPLAQVIRDRVPIWINAPSPLSERFIGLPLITNDQVIGAIGLTFDLEQTLRDEQQAFLDAITQQCAQALERARLYEGERKARESIYQMNMELERRVHQRTEELLEVNKQLEAFSYTVSHDLRAPLRSIQGFSRILLEDYADLLDTIGKDFTTRIVTAAERMDRLLIDLLTYSRLTRAELDLEPIDLNVVIRDIQLQLKALLDEQHAQINVIGDLASVRGHRALLDQVITNLITNAIKFVKPNEAPLVEVWSEIHGDCIRLCIQDHGIGIASEHQERIFRIFERLHTADKYPGTGIGLAIVQKGIERMGGRVGLESMWGAGSCFWIELPR